MSTAYTTWLVTSVSAGLVFFGTFTFFYAIAHAHSLPGRRWADRYVVYLDRRLRVCFLKLDPWAIVRAQAVGITGGLLATLLSGSLLVICVPALFAVAPAAYLRWKRRQRSRNLTAQTDTFLLGLANSLKAVPTLGAALAGLLPVLENPLREEMVLALNELRVGNSIDQALLNAAARAQSPALDSALSALLVGQKVGGDLPRVLETTAATLREIHRLEGVVQSKTSESRAQLWVLAFFPLGILLLFSAVSPEFFDPLFHTFTGQVVSIIALLLWGTAVLLARQLSKVDL